MASILIWPPAGYAQATLPAPGTAQIALSYQYFSGGDHLFSTDIIDGQSTRGYVADGRRWDLGNTQTQTVHAAVDVGLHRRLAVTLGAAFVAATYDGRSPVDFEVDNGDWHGNVQDARVRARTPFVIGSNLLTPYAEVQFALTDYPVTGHAAPGRGHTAVGGGVYGLRGIGPYASTGSISAGFGYRFVTNVDYLDLRHLHADFRFGYLYRSI